MRRLWVTLAIMFTTGAAGYVIVTNPGSAAAANLWVNATAQTCTRSATAVSFTVAQSNGWLCSWDGANDLCQNGDTVKVRGGSYGNINLTGANSRTSQCLVSVDSGQSVTVGTISDCRGGSSGCMSQMSITGPLTAVGDHGFDSCNNCTFDNIDFNLNWLNGCIGSCGGSSNGPVQPFHAENITGSFTVKNSKIHNAVNSNAMIYLSGSGPWLFDTVDIYNQYDTTNGTLHTEGIYATSVSNITFRRVRFWAVPTEVIFITGSEQATNWVIENSIIEKPLGPNANALAFRGPGSPPTPSPDGFTIRNSTFGRDAGVQWDATDNAATANGWFMYGNIFIDQPPPCSGTNITVNYTVTVSACGSNNTTATRSTILGGFVNAKDWTAVNENGGCNASTNPATGCTDATPGNYALLTSSVAKDVCQTAAYPGSASGFPAIDFLGVTRPVNSTADCGAYEFQP